MAKITSYQRVIRNLFSLALPMMLAQLIMIGSNFLTMVMLGKLGKEVLAASALIFSIRTALLISFSAIFFALSILIGHAYGEKEYLRIGNFTKYGWLLAGIIVIPVMIIFWKIDLILNLLGQPARLTKIVHKFFIINIWSVFPFMFAICNQQLCYGTGKQKIDFIANIIGVVALLVSSYALIFGNWGIPKLGVEGLAYALNLQAWVYFLYTSLIISFDHFFKQFKLFSFYFHQKWNDFVKILQIGCPIAIQIGGEMLSIFVYTAMIGWLGTNSLAAYQVISQYYVLIMVPLFALAQAGSVLVGLAKGENNETKIKMIGNTVIFVTLIVTLIIAYFFITYPQILASAYIDIKNPIYEETLHYIILLFVICAFLQIFDALRNILTGLLRGLFDAKFPMLVGLAVIWLIGIPGAYILAFPLHLGVIGVVIGSTVGMVFGMIILFYRWERMTKNYFKLKGFKR